MSVYKTEGIVLHQFDLGEADKIITFYTRDRGKVKAVAKGVRRPRSSQAGATQSFTYADLLIYKGKTLDKLSQISAKETFAGLRNDLLKMSYGTYILELVREITVEDDPHEGMFVLLLKTLYLLAQEIDLEMITRIFELRAMSLMGFRPILDTCLQCANQLSGEKIQFHPGSGGVLCSRCFSRVPGQKITISRGTLEIMKRFLNASFHQLLKIKLPRYARQELEIALEAFVQYHLDHKLKSLAFLKSVKEMLSK